MPNPLFRPPRHLVKEWPEVFEDLYMNTMPVAYLDLVHLEFKDGRIWEIDIKNELEAKLAIAKWLGYPLGRLLPEQIAEINEIVSENLDKKFVMAQVKELFKIKLILQEKGEWK